MPRASWPCDDKAGSKVLASGIAGGMPMTFTGSPKLASNSDFVCSLPLPVLNGASFTGNVPAYTSSGGAIIVRFLLSVPSGGDTAGWLMNIATSGTYHFVIVYAARASR